AEMGVNHNGDMNLVRELIDKAAEAGVDAIKFQKFTTEDLVTVNAPKAKYQEATTSQDETQFQMLKKLELSTSQLKDLKNYADSKGILSFATPFDEKSVDFLEELEVQAYKIGSGDVTNLPLLRKVASKNKPLILSTGMSTLGEVEDAVNAVLSTGNQELVLMHCTSNYPTDLQDVNLKAMDTIAAAFGLPTGYSDHTMGITVSVAAVARGAVAIEKHFTLDRSLEGPDHAASLEPEELSKLVKEIRNVETCLGTAIKKPANSELEVKLVAQKSIVAATDIKKGQVITQDMLTFKRPSSGIQPKYVDLVVGRVATENIIKDSIITWEML
ncbi:N-acetylneuraminate synthase, partial [Priestia megaterium]|uniref:N-acetylneuraminate synthase n=1 Tax=Priestia megaterium TaxID=1404 RepID=UPI00300087B1